MAEPRGVTKLEPIVDEQTKAAGILAAAKTAATMPKVDPLTGELPDLFAGKFGFIDALANDPIYGEEIQKIKEALLGQNPTLAETLYRKSKWAQLDSDAQNAYLLKLQNSKLYQERLKSWMIAIKKSLAAKGLSADDTTLEKYYVDGIDNATIIDELAAKIDTMTPKGELGTALQNLRNIADANGLNLEKDFKTDLPKWLSDISRGTPITDFYDVIRQKAAEGKSKFVKDQLALGKNLSQIYGKYISAIATAFDIDPESVSLNDELLNKAFTDEGGIKLSDFQNLIRSDARFAKTPAAAAQAELRQQIIDRALALGAKVANTDIDTILKELLSTGAGSFGQATIDAKLRSFITTAAATPATGQAGNNLQILEKLAADNGLDLNATFGSDIQNWLQKIDQGESIETYKKIIRQKAGEGKPKFVQDQLKQGNDLRLIYANYINAMASAFNVPVDSIDINDPLLQKAFTDKGAIKLNEFQNLIRQDNRYGQTPGAASEADFRKQIIDRAVAIGAAVTSADIDNIVSKLLATGISPSASSIDAELRNFITYGTGSTVTGQAGNNLEVLKNTAAANGLDLDKAFGGSVQEWLRKIDQGESIETYKRIIRDAAKLGLPENVKKLLDQGVDLTTIFNPYRNYMGQILEINPDTIDINDPVLRSAIGPEKEMTLYEFQRSLRKDPRWQYTNQARADVSDAIKTVARDFGLAG